MKGNDKRQIPSARPTSPHPRNIGNNAQRASSVVKRQAERSTAPQKEKRPSLLRRISLKVRILAAFALVAVIFIVCMAVNISIGVREIVIEGNALCTRDEILGAAEIEEGSGYFSYNTSKAEKKVREQFYCVEEISISRSVFGRVTVKLTETDAHWYVESYGEYFALSDDLTVVKSDEKRDRFISCGLVRLSFPEIKSAVLGKTLEIRDGDRDTSYVGELLEDVQETELYKTGRIFEIKVKTKFEVFIVVDRRHFVTIGNCNDVEGKMRALSRTLSDDHFVGDGFWEINVSDAASPTARENAELDFSYLYPSVVVQK